MSMAGLIEAGAIERFLHEHLKTSPEVSGLVGDKIAAGLHPQGTDTPYISYNMRSGRGTVPLNSSSAERTSGLFRYQIYAVTEGGHQYEEADLIALKVDKRLVNASGIVEYLGGNYFVQIGPQEEPIRVQIPGKGHTYNQVGGVYLIQVQPS